MNTLLRKILIFIMFFLFTLTSSFLKAQVLEKFNETDGSTSFSQSGSTFNITGSYLEVEQKAGWGYDDDFFVENSDNMMTAATVVGSFLCTSSDFNVHSVYLITLNSSHLIEQTNDILIRGKLNGSSIFTHTVLFDQINVTSANNYYT